MKQIEINNLSYSYPGGQKAIKSLSLSLEGGESLGIIGPNGAGKSTLLKLMIGIFDANEGQIIIENEILNKKTLSSIRKRCGFLFQNPDDQLFCSTVKEDVAFGPLNMGLTPQLVELQVNRALEITGTSHLSDRPPYTLSGGEKRAAALASVLSMSPEILLFDETSANLDPKSRRSLIKIVKELNQTKIIVSHDLDFILDTCTMVIILNKGRITARGATKEILTDRITLEQNGLELPLRLQDCPICHKNKNMIEQPEPIMIKSFL